MLIRRKCSSIHANENVRPGYYAVKLQQPNVWVELTATKRAGFHRYTFGADVKKAQLVLDLFQGIGWDKPTDYALDEVKETTVAGIASLQDGRRTRRISSWLSSLNRFKYNRSIVDAGWFRWQMPPAL